MWPFLIQHFQIPGDAPLKFQTKIKVVDIINGQIVPSQVSGPRPPALQNIKLGVEDVNKESVANSNQSFLVKYV
jgi:hypothetical protein